MLWKWNVRFDKKHLITQNKGKEKYFYSRYKLYYKLNDRNIANRKLV